MTKKDLNKCVKDMLQFGGLALSREYLDAIRVLDECYEKWEKLHTEIMNRLPCEDPDDLLRIFGKYYAEVQDLTDWTPTEPVNTIRGGSHVRI